MKPHRFASFLLAALSLAFAASASAQIGRRFPSEKKIVPDPVTGVPLTFLTSTPAGDSKIYQTHHQWTSDGKWLIFRSNRVPGGQAMAVNEETGDIVQVTESGFQGMLCISDISMTLYFLRTQRLPGAEPEAPPPPPTPGDAAAAPGARGGRGGRGGPRGPTQIIAVDLAKLFADSAAGTLKASTEYEHIKATIPPEMGPPGDMALDPTEDFAYVRVGSAEASKHLPADTKPEPTFGPRGMGAGPTGLINVNLKTGETKFIIAVPFQIGHVQTNPWNPGEIVFCWETGGKAPTRMWTVMADGSGLRPVYPEAPYDWITHETVITKDEVAFAMLYLRSPLGGRGRGPGGGAANQKGGGEPKAPPAPLPPEQAAILDQTGMDGHPTGVGIVNLRTREMRIVGQVPLGDPGRSIWHVNGSPDGRWAVADDFQYRLWLIDRHSGEMNLLADMGHKTTAADHIHPTFNADSTKIEIQSAMLSENGRSLNIVVVPIPKAWLARTYSEKVPQ
jgi:oligogalacturonide lyase